MAASSNRDVQSSVESGCGPTEGAIVNPARLQLRYRITYLTSIVHTFSLISLANRRMVDSIFFCFKAFTIPHMMVFVDFGLLLET
jgi:hypothetical protein